MSSGHTTIAPLNPDVQFNHLPPSEAHQFEISRNIILAILGAAIWDILVYVIEDVRIIRRSRFHFVVFCFVFSRLSAIGFALVNTIERTLPSNNLNVPATTSGALCMISMVTSSFLFLQRVQAIYADTRWVRWLFFALWVAISASDIVIPLGIHPKPIPGTHFYRGSIIPPYDALSVFTLLLFDTSVLLAISYKIASGHVSIPTAERVPWYSVITGRTLPRLSRSILRGGQQYYLITVGMTIFAGITVTLPSIPQIFKPTYPTIMVALMASMASRVYRNTKLFDLNVVFTETRTPNIPGV